MSITTRSLEEALTHGMIYIKFEDPKFNFIYKRDYYTLERCTFGQLDKKGQEIWEEYINKPIYTLKFSSSQLSSSSWVGLDFSSTSTIWLDYSETTRRYQFKKTPFPPTIDRAVICSNSNNWQHYDLSEETHISETASELQVELSKYFTFPMSKVLDFHLNIPV
jgi:hypothetical protein